MKTMVVMRFISRMVAGIIVSIILGNYLDERFNTTPFIMMVLLVYVIGGSLYQLVKEAGDHHER